MITLNDSELMEVNGGSWLAVAGGIALGILCLPLAPEAGLVAGAVYAIECELAGV